MRSMIRKCWQRLTAMLLAVTIIVTSSGYMMADRAEAAGNPAIEGPITTDGRIAKRPYYDAMVSYIQSLGLTNNTFNASSQNVLNIGTGKEYACAGFVGAVLYYILEEQIGEVSDFKEWGGVAWDTMAGSYGSRYGHGAPSQLIYYFGAYNPNSFLKRPSNVFTAGVAGSTESTPPNPIKFVDVETSPYPYYKAGTTQNTASFWEPSWEVADYYFGEVLDSSRSGLQVYNKLVEAYNAGKIAAGDVIFFYRWNSSSYDANVPDNGSMAELLPHVGFIGNLTTTYNQTAIKDYIGSDYVDDVELAGITGKSSDQVLTCLNITNGYDWYNYLEGKGAYNHINYAPMPAFFDKNASKAKHKYRNSGNYADKYSVGYIVYKHTSDTTGVTGNLEISKSSDSPSVTVLNNDAYVLGGAEYGIYKEDKTTLVSTVTIDSNNKATATDLEEGTYYIKETAAPKGYKLDTGWHGPYTVTAGNTTKAAVSDTPKTGEMTLVKKSASPDYTGDAYSLEGAVYTVYYNPSNKTVLTGNGGSYSLSSGTSKVGEFTIDKNGTGKVTYSSFSGLNTGKISGMPIGHYMAVETTLPSGGGYEWDANNHYFEITESNCTETVKVEAVDEAKDDPVFVEINKTDAEGNVIEYDRLSNPLSGAVFEIKYYDEVYASKDELPAEATRTWYVQTFDDNKVYTARLASSKSFLETAEIDGKEYTSSERYRDADGNVVVPIGTITVKEVKAADGYILESGIMKAGDKVFEDRVAFGTITEDNSGKAKLSFGATNELSVSNDIERGDLKFSKANLDGNRLPDIDFNLSLLDKDNNKLETHKITTDADGEFDSSKSDVYFYGTSEKIKWKKENIDTTRGHLIVGKYLLEEIKNEKNEGLQMIDPVYFTVTKDGQKVDKGTQVDVPNPGIRTLEWDNDTKTHMSMADSEVKVLDTVSYQNLEANTKYTVKGIIVDTSGNALKDDNGNIIVSHKTFTTPDTENKKAASGNVEMTFTFAGEKLAGKKFVIFEYLFEGEDDTDITVTDDKPVSTGVYRDNDGVEVKHTDTSDEDQTGFSPKLSTQAKVQGTDEQYAKAGETVNIIDTVKYTNLIPGEEFTVSGKIVDASTGKVIQSDGRNVTATKTFKPDKANGSIEMMFTVNMTGFEGKTLAVYETVTYKKYGTVVAKHTNPKDTKQQIHIPDMGTQASDNVTGNNLSYADGRVVINDVISYSNLEPGKTYTVNGKLVEKITNADGIVSEGGVIKDSQGNEVTASDTFVASDTGNGTVTVRFEFDAADDLAGKTAVAFEEIPGYAAHADINDKPQTIKFPKIGTTAKDVKTLSQIAEASENVELVDTISYENLNAGESYIIFGQLMDKDSGEPVLDADGHEITATIENFVPEKDKGTVDMTFSFNGSILGGRTTVVFERISRNINGKDVTIAKHAELTSAKQTIAFPGGYTTAMGEATGNHHVAAGEEVTVIDTVYYSNLLPNTTYTLEGRLMLKPKTEDEQDDAERIATSGDAEPLSEKDDDNGLDSETGNGETEENDSVPRELMSKTISFTTGTAPEGEMFVSGSVEMSFTFDASILEGRSVVAFETVKQEGVTVFTHADIEDEDQTILIPKIRTTVKDAVTGDHISAGNRMIKVIDTVQYDNLLPSTEYVITGKLMDKETGEAFLDADGKEVVSVLAFTTPDTSEGGLSVSGSIDMEFEFNAAGITGKEVVVFEALYSKDVEVAVHADIEDEGQTFYIPGGHTEAKNGKTGTHTAKAEKEVTIIDTVYYEKLLPNKEYTIKGILMDKATGEPLLVDGEEVVAETSFVTANDESGESVNGSIEMKFTFDASALEGKSVVVFETVYKDGKEVFVHADIEDEDQTVSFPRISTTADIDNGRKRAEEAKNLVIRDQVEYENLTIGEKYTVKGVLMDPRTGSPLLIKGKQVTAEAEFIPESENGSIEVSFTFDGTDLLEPDQSMKVVAFETLYAENGEELAKHTEIDDEKQTVEIYKPKKPPKTGDGFNMILIIVIGTAAAFILAATKKRRKDS